MKALVLAGGFPQIALIKELRRRGIFVVLADYYEKPVARAYADSFYRVSTLDVEERKTIYKRALELSTGIAVEIPTYQRKNMFVYNKTVIDGASLFSGEDVTPFQSPLSFVWNVELLD